VVGGLVFSTCEFGFSVEIFKSLFILNKAKTIEEPDTRKWLKNSQQLLRVDLVHFKDIFSKYSVQSYFSNASRKVASAESRPEKVLRCVL
jgi:hypothetical protein